MTTKSDRTQQPQYKILDTNTIIIVRECIATITLSKKTTENETNWNVKCWVSFGFQELLTLHKWYMAAYAKTLLTFTLHETGSYKINQVAAYLKS